MKRIAKPKHIFWFVTLPIGFLSLVLSFEFNLSSREPVSGSLPLLLATLAVVLVSVGYGIIRRVKEEFDKPAAIALCAVSAALLVLSLLLGTGGRVWLLGIPIGLRLFALLLCAVPAFYSIVVLARAIAPPAKADAGHYLLGLAALPFLWFLAFNIAGGANAATLAIIILVAGAFAALFLLLRAIAARRRDREPAIPVEMTKKARRRKIAMIVLHAIFSVALPMAGLFLNLAMGNIFGNYAHAAFFIVPVLNGLLLFLPQTADRRLRLARFCLLCASLPYYVYFFVVFLPYMPLGVLGLIFYLLGVLILTPAVALVLQILTLIREWKALRPLWARGRVLACFLASLLLLPLLLLSSVIGDRANFQTAMSYLESSESAPQGTVDVKRLERTIENGVTEENFSFSRDLLGGAVNGNNTPLLSSVYSALVLRRGELRDTDIKALKRIFLPAGEVGSTGSLAIRDGLTVNENAASIVRLNEITTETRYDADIGAYRSWVHLELQNPYGNNEEYVTLFSLPEGAYISDYYLDVFGTRKYGILADERAAMAVYESIVRVRRDPGVIHYIDDGRLELRVFPFTANETRQSGFEVMHSQSVEFTFGGQTVLLQAENAPETLGFPGGTLLSAAYKEGLPVTEARAPVYHFLVDSSAYSDVEEQLRLVQDYAYKYSIQNPRVLLTSYDVTEMWLDRLSWADIKPQYGFNLALAIKQILQNSDAATVPVILFTSDNPAAAEFPKYSAALAAQFPECPYYYQLRADLKLIPLSFADNSAYAPVTAPVFLPARVHEGRFVRDDGGSEIVCDGSLSPAKYRSSGNAYMDALTLHTLLRHHPAISRADSLIPLRGSFRAHVLTPQSAFIVVETAEQEQQIWDAQKRLMEEDKGLRPAERRNLAEPPIWVLLVVAGVAVLGAVLVRRRGRRHE